MLKITMDCCVIRKLRPFFRVLLRCLHVLFSRCIFCHLLYVNHQRYRLDWSQLNCRRRFGLPCTAHFSCPRHHQIYQHTLLLLALFPFYLYFSLLRVVLSQNVTNVFLMISFHNTSLLIIFLSTSSSLLSPSRPNLFYFSDNLTTKFFCFFCLFLIVSDMHITILYINHLSA